MRLNFWKKPEKKEGIVKYQDGVYFFGTGKISAPKLSSYLNASSINDTVYGCIGLITLAALDVDWYVYQREGDKIREITGHALNEFIERPSKMVSWSRFIETYLNNILLAGEFYARRFVGSFKTRVELDLLRPDRVTPRGNRLFMQSYDYSEGGKLEHIPPEEILFVRFFNPHDDLRGLSPITSIATQIDIASFSQNWMLALLENGAMPAIAFSMPENKILTQEQRAYLDEKIKNKVLGHENVMNPLLLEGGMKPEKIGFSPKDIDFMPLSKSTLRKICNVYHVAPELLGDSENKTYNNMKEANKALYELATFPLLNLLRDELNNGIVPFLDDTGKMFIDYDTSDVEALADDKDALWKRIGEAVDRGLITRTEGREVIKYGKAKEKAADKLTVTGMVQPLDTITGDQITEK